MIIQTDKLSFDFSSRTGVRIPELIEKVRNLQYNIINELYKPCINYSYIKECNSLIDNVILEIIEKNNKLLNEL